ncbi:aldehyde dehydrogenase [Phtheirospermum japonicum]|uniref:Aldehyde dehydrogenase n=1 Tax=Phtheirospermum japonicum TaxID=374723 RepID=A0A830BQL3_9LAMI|nr:aldehyde dehydrogenase [Phtheirospermum japonicum]
MAISTFHAVSAPHHPTAVGGVDRVARDLRSVYGGGKTKSYDWRVSQLEALIKITSRHERDIIEALRSDLNKPEFEAFVHEVYGVSTSCKLALKQLHQWMKPQRVETSLINFPSSGEIVSEPLGVVLVISSWNYPFILSLDPVIGAIAAGNAVVLKPSEVAPASSALMAELLSKYMDTSAVKVVQGGVLETTALLEQKWDKIFYTGNGTVGRIILTAAAKHLTPVVLELGGKCPVVVNSDVDIKVAVRRIITGKWGSNNGQACIAPDHVITTKEYALKLVNVFSSELEKFFGKDPLRSKDLSSIINYRHFDRLTMLLDDNKISGKVVIGGQRDKANLKIAPTVFLDAPKDSLVMNEEIFGPLLPIVTVDKIEDSIALINSKGKPLAAYLFTNDETLKEKFVGNVSSGAMVINDTLVHVLESNLPFGGVGESGMGAYRGKYTFDTFSHKKAVLHRGLFDMDVKYPPFPPQKTKLLKALITGDILSIPRALIGW